MPNLRSNRDLLTAFRAGDRDALQKVYWLYVRAVEAVIRRLFQQVGSGRSNDVLDAVQETFIRAFSSAARQSYDGVRDDGPYLNMTARNVALRWLESTAARARWSPSPSLRADDPEQRAGQALWEDPEFLASSRSTSKGCPRTCGRSIGFATPCRPLSGRRRNNSACPASTSGHWKSTYRRASPRIELEAERNRRTGSTQTEPSRIVP